MKEVKNVIAYFVGAFFIIAAGWILTIVSGWNLPYEALLEGLNWLKFHPWEDLILAAALLVLGILPFLRFRAGRGEPTFIAPSRLGEVRISEAAMKDIVVRSGYDIPAVRQLQPHLRQREDGIEVLIYAQLNPEVVIPETIEQLQVKVKEDIERFTGIRIVEVKVLVRNVETAHPSRVR